MKWIRIAVPPIERINGCKPYGNKYLKFWKNTIARENYITAYICGVKESFDATQDGWDEMEEWIDQKRKEIAKCLKLDSEEEK